ncbi:MAG TPA: sigma-54-dependent Fis family transcriptional regulator [Methylothermaceae bacterium]|nr:sigma-54-dependent Fis family transcriptional regulator [Methylothermaceae bacterium]
MTDTRILVVDDEAKMRRLMELMLVQMGYQVESAADGLEALPILERQDIDLVITDLRMPRLDGMGLLKRLQEQNNEVPVIVITAYGTVESAVEAMKQGAFDYLLRPFELETLEAVVCRALEVGRMRRENRFLRRELEKGWGGLIGRSAAMRQVYEAIDQVAPTKASVLLLGETGTGKELVARAIHQTSPRAANLFVPVNCAAIPADILESELFGHARGAFTGAHKERVGKFELAQGGTLFLDEITEMPFPLQAKLLRVLQEKTVERLGSNRTIELDIRIIAATNRDPLKAVAEKKLREDLYYRLNVFTIELPPLRRREGDIPLLARHFLEKHAAEFGYPCPDLASDALAWLETYPWPGNVRELENMMERALVLTRGQGTVSLRHLPVSVRGETVGPDSDEAGDSLLLGPQVAALERRLIGKALDRSCGNKAEAARLLGISERTLWYKLKKYDL